MCGSHFALTAFSSLTALTSLVARRRGTEQRSQALEQAKNGTAEVMVIGISLFTRPEHFKLLLDVDWKVIMVDEYHEYKTTTGNAHKNIITLQTNNRNSLQFRPVVGLTGTLMQNSHKELWSLSSIIDRDAFGTYNDFKETFETPIKLSRKKDAFQTAIAKVRREEKRKQTIHSKL